MPRLAAGIGRSLDGITSERFNPWHNLGALGFYLFWIVTVRPVGRCVARMAE